MKIDYGIDEDVSAVFTSSSTIFYVVVINIVPFLTKIFSKKNIMVVGLLSCVFGIIILSPLTDIGIPDKWWVVVIGLPFIGICNAFCVLPQIPLSIELMTEWYDDEELN